MSNLLFNNWPKRVGGLMCPRVFVGMALAALMASCASAPPEAAAVTAPAPVVQVADTNTGTVNGDANAAVPAALDIVPAATAIDNMNVPPAADSTARVTGPAAPGTSAAPVAAAVEPVKPVLDAANQQLFDDGVQALKDKRFNDALTRFVELQNKAPDYVPGYLNAALAKRGQNDLDGARGQLQSAETHALVDVRLYNLIGLVERERGKFDLAKAAYERAVTIEDSYAPAHRNYAILADYYLQEPALALTQMDRYLQLIGEDKQVSSWVAELRRRVEKIGAASP